MEGQLRASGQKACLVIATDGESGDGDIITAMQPLRNLPVWVVSLYVVIYIHCVYKLILYSILYIDTKRNCCIY